MEENRIFMAKKTQKSLKISRTGPLMTEKQNNLPKNGPITGKNNGVVAALSSEQLSCLLASEEYFVY